MSDLEQALNNTTGIVLRHIAELEAEVQALREAVTALAKIAPQNNARAAILKKLEVEGEESEDEPC